MTAPSSPESPPRPSGAGKCALALVLFGITAAAVALFAFPPDGHERASLLQLFGRFHPLIVHLPIGLLVIVPVLEIMGARRGGGSLRAAAGFVLGAGVVTAMGGIITGWLLAYGGGESYARVSPHMTSALILAMVASVAFWTRCQWAASGRAGWGNAYGMLLIVTWGFLGYTGHQGGVLTHGDSFLTAHLPERFRTWFGAGDAPRSVVAPSAAQSIYSTHLQPIFEARCMNCHDADDSGGELRLETYALLMQGSEDGPVIAPGNPLESTLYRRVILPPTAKGAMPAKQKEPPLTATEVRLIEWWISEGALETLTAANAKYVPADVRTILAAEPVPSLP